MSSVFVTGLQGTCCCRCCSLVACPSAHQRWSTIFAERKGPEARRVCTYRPVPPGAAGRCFVWPLQCICSQSYASRASLHLAHPGATAGAPFERNERDRQACGYARIVRYHQELHPGSLVAVWVLVRAKLWRVVCVWCGSEGRGRRHPRSVRNSAGGGSGRAYGCAQSDDHRHRRCRQVITAKAMYLTPLSHLSIHSGATVPDLPSDRTNGSGEHADVRSPTNIIRRCRQIVW